MNVALVPLILVLSAAALGSIPATADAPIVGAIRWDAWTGGAVTAQVTATLSPPEFHDRLPWFAAVDQDGTLTIDGGPQSVMDREIGFAADAGLDYWAFLLYPEADTMSTGLQQYLESAHRSRIGFCLILHNAFGVPPAAWPHERDRAIALLQEPGYQTVLDGRPLVFSFQVPLDNTAFAGRIQEFLEGARAQGVDPYLVYMGWNPRADFANASAFGFEAVSAYAYGTNLATFAELAEAVERDYWRAAADARVPVIPLVTTGWDKRPRQVNPVSWERDHAYHTQETFPSLPAPGEIAAHLQRALAFVRENAAICPANAVIIYAWNEYDEGGWLAPTRADDGSPNAERLDAIRPLLRGSDPGAP